MFVDIDSILDAGGDSAGNAPEPKQFELMPVPADEVEKPAEDTPAEDKSAEKASAEVKPAEETPAEDSPEEKPKTRRAKTESRIKNIGSDDLPREKAFKYGFNALSDAELLAILLGSGIPGKSVLDLAQEILSDNDRRLGVLSRRSIPWLMKKYKGMGQAKATLLMAAMTVGARAQADLQKVDPQISSSAEVYNLMRDKLERANHEEFWVLHLSRAGRVQSEELISKGGQFQTTVDVKLIAKSVIDRLSSAVILCHNHPSGNMTPSAADDQLTRRIQEVCKIVDVPVLDHVIVGPTGFYSYRDEGKLR